MQRYYFSGLPTVHCYILRAPTNSVCATSPLKLLLGYVEHWLCSLSSLYSLVMSRPGIRPGIRLWHYELDVVLKSIGGKLHRFLLLPQNGG